MAALDEVNPFTVSVEHNEDQVVILVAGELDLATAPELVEALNRETLTNGRACIDMRDCTFIDSSGLQAIVSSARDFRRDGGELSVTELNGDVAALFRLSGLLLKGSALVYRDAT